ncbi:hypothetical protein HMPREF0971_00834 [Segatella oris F0302]|uniref:Uncharacterized protein n=1 Tax=Segatella oris F0302 TaxID=649760 RepID=D1QPE4_9BACT|nr:hypothetical protein HMPREF0971_00834 [Segatella oris F0302]
MKIRPFLACFISYCQSSGYLFSCFFKCNFTSENLAFCIISASVLP